MAEVIANRRIINLKCRGVIAKRVEKAIE